MDKSILRQKVLRKNERTPKMVRVVSTINLGAMWEALSAKERKALKEGKKLSIQGCELVASRYDDDGDGSDRDFRVEITYNSV